MRVNADHETSLFQDDIITVISRVDENWAEGKIGDKVGIFPILFVEVRSLYLIQTYSEVYVCDSDS